MEEPAKNISRKLAEEHWNWVESLAKKIYIDAFVHGYKHGLEDYEIK